MSSTNTTLSGTVTREKLATTIIAAVKGLANRNYYLPVAFFSCALCQTLDILTQLQLGHGYMPTHNRAQCRGRVVGFVPRLQKPIINVSMLVKRNDRKARGPKLLYVMQPKTHAELLNFAHRVYSF